METSRKHGFNLRRMSSVSDRTEIHLSQCQCAVAFSRDRVAMLAIRGMSAAVTHDTGPLLALDIAVDTRHPRGDLVHQLSLAERQDVVGPGIDAGGCRLDAR